MIPRQLRADTKSRAEKALYTALQRQLPDDVVVFHHVPWQVRDMRSGARDGEADFIVADPDRGFLIVEVKGGPVRYDGAMRQWYSGRYPIDDPFEQATSCKYSLLSLLKEQSYWRNRYVRMAHAVAFPDVVVAHTKLRPDAPREIVLDSTQMHDLNGWVHNVFEYWNGLERRSDPPGAEGLRQLINLISPTVDLRPLLGVTIAEEEQELVRATEEQFYILDLLGHQRQLAVLGCAGSGKTLIAAEKARRLCAQGFRVLLTCFNRNLAEFLHASIGDSRQLVIKHFHGLCADLAREAGLWRSTSMPLSTDFFAKKLPEQLVEAADILNWHVDAVIVDEGQDFREEWWLALRYLLNDPDNGIFYVFFDDHQNLYSSGSLPLEVAPVVLRKNCRNTRAIQEYVSTYYRSDHPITAIGPAGRVVEVLKYQTEGDLKQLLRKQIHHLVRKEQVDPEDIVILTPRAPHRSALRQMGMLGEFSLTDTPGGSGEIFWTNIYQFKGLESPVVILVEIDTHVRSNDIAEITIDTEAQLASSRVVLTPEMLMYVGTSRARHHLIVAMQE
jgi:hypothetical protein